MLHEINWPHGYLPGYTDNFASNEVIVRDLTAKEVFDTLIDASLWETYYKNSSDVEFDNTPGLILAADTRFRFKTFGFPVVPPKTEYSLTDYGRTLAPIVKEMCEWGESHLADQILPSETK